MILTAVLLPPFDLGKMKGAIKTED